MFSRLIVRTVLAIVIALLFWAIGFNWTSPRFTNTAQRVTLSLVECGVLLAALSLLIESFLSFGNIKVRRGSWRYVFFGINAFDFDEDGHRQGNTLAVRTCELFALSSVLLAFTGLLTAVFLLMSWEAIKFLVNPHTLTINWNEVFTVMKAIFGGTFAALLLIWGSNYLAKKTAGKSLATQVVVLGSYWVVFMSLLAGFLITTAGYDKKFAAMPYYAAILYSSGFAFLVLSGVGVVLAISYGLFRLAGKAIVLLSGKFPVLEQVWNQICPLQTIHFVE